VSSQSEQPIRVLLVDDHEIVRLGLRTLLGRRQGLEVVGEAATAAEAVAEADRLAPDVVLLDVRLPDGSGVEVCREILARTPTARVLFLSSYADQEAVLATIFAGAAGYVLKEITSDSLLRAIRAVVAGQSILDPAVTQPVLARMQALAQQGPQPDEHGLSPQESRVLALVAEGKTNKEIAAALDLGEKTVKNYLGHIFQKLKVTRRSQAAAIYSRQAPHR
jgi:DNA-binding NarL/FixJ family response regulator